MKLVRKIALTVAWIIACIALLIAVVLVVALHFDWNRFKPMIDQQASTALGRPFAINGDLTIGWQRPRGETGWRTWVFWPSLQAKQIVLGNPDWAKNPQFATLDAARVDVEVLPLLDHKVVIPSIELDRPAIDLERRADGSNTWTFKPATSNQPSAWQVKLGKIGFATGTVDFRDAITKADLHVTIDTLGQPIPLGEVMAEQERTSREASMKRVGRKGAALLAKRADQEVAREASAASAAAAASAAEALSSTSASGASGVAATGAPASSVSGSAAVSATASVAPASAASGALPASAASAAADQSTPTYAFGLTVKGHYKGMPIDGTGKIGGVLALDDPRTPFPLQADIHAGTTRLAIVGTLTDPTHLAAIDLRLWLAGQSLAQLYTVAGVALPETPPYATEGRLIGHFKRQASSFSYQDFNGRVGGSDLHGTLTWDQQAPRPKLSGKLESNLLQFSDLAPIIGADSAASRKARGDTTPQPSNRVLPDEKFKTDRWKALDTDVTFIGHKLIKNGSLPITDLSTHIVLNDGVLSLEPLTFGVAGGTLSTTAHLDGSAEPLKGQFTLSARHLKLRQLFATQKVMQSALGEINGDASLSATGNSPAALAATATGNVKALVNNGKVSALLMEAAGLNVANVVYEKLFGGKDVNINCAAIDFQATNGLLNTRMFALDTEDAVINVDGTVNLADESMNLDIHPHSKGFRVLSLRSPLYVKGTFKNPDVGVNIGALALRAGAAIGLGFVNPFAALIPLILPSNGTGVPCTQMFAELKAPGALKASRSK